MATLKDVVELIITELQQRQGVSVGEQCARELEQMIRQSYGGDRIYVRPPDTSKRAAVEQAVRTLPATVVAERFGVTAHYARKVMRHGVKRKE